ncbi:hypothetical protein GO491_12005 [Flavobacteriaceae bacterium Ap0902]|nr:hypothetical protein [Flavobacteriaceae bacterium Ap0902]
MKTKELQNKIAELKAGRTMKAIKAEDIKLYYKIQGLSSKLSELKAYNKGQFITKEHLTEYKPLIIWLLKNKTNYKGYLNLKNAMTILLSYVEGNNLVYKTERGIKGIISNLAIEAGLEDVEDNLRRAKNLDMSRDNTVENKRVLDHFYQFRLDALMG